jgi:hypothetical protein
MLDRSSLRPLLAAYLDGEMSLFDFRGRFYSGDIRLRDDAEDGLYQVISMHLAMYTAGSWPESTLKAAIRWLSAPEGMNGVLGSPMVDAQWLEIMNSGLAPWPITVTVGTTEPRDERP